MLRLSRLLLSRRRARRRAPRRAQADSDAEPPAHSERPKAPPGDPDRQGNIWHRYEQLEHATKSLASLNQQLLNNKNRHQRARPARPPRVQNQQLPSS